MLSMNELNLVHRIETILRKRGCWVLKTHGSNLRLGVPDLLISYPISTSCGMAVSVFVAIEVKIPGKKPTAIQEYELAKIRKSGGIAFYADDPDSVIETIEREIQCRSS